MKKQEILNTLLGSKIVAVIRAESEKKAIEISDAVIRGGIKAIEITYTIPNANNVIYSFSQQYNATDVAIGAGTVLDMTTAREAILSGAEFIVSPSFNKDVAKICNLYSIPYIPGCMTPREVQKALEYGSDIIKAFPADVVGYSFVKSIKGPYPNVKIMVTGGVDINNLLAWKYAGADLIGTGSNLTVGAKNNDFDSVTRTTQEYLDRYSERDTVSI